MCFSEHNLVQAGTVSSIFRTPELLFNLRVKLVGLKHNHYSYSASKHALEDENGMVPRYHFSEMHFQILIVKLLTGSFRCSSPRCWEESFSILLMVACFVWGLIITSINVFAFVLLYTCEKHNYRLHSFLSFIKG